jgi:MoaA/NifB/PqqE/SkfB family radical SAM enzyme
MMTPHLHEKLAEMDRFGVKLEMITNATLMAGDELLERLVRIMGYLRVSIDGASRATYNRLRVGADFDDVIANVRRYNWFRHRMPEGSRAPLDFAFILMKSTLAELSDFIRLARDLDVHTVHVNHLVLFEEQMRHEMLGDSPAWRRRANEVIQEARETAEAIGQRVALPPPFSNDGVSSPDATSSERTRCWFLWQRMFVGPLGHVAPCCLAGIHANGNVHGSTFAEIWNNSLYQDMRRRVHSDRPYPPCATCYLVNRSPDTGDHDRTNAWAVADEAS